MFGGNALAEQRSERWRIVCYGIILDHRAAKMAAGAPQKLAETDSNGYFSVPSDLKGVMTATATYLSVIVLKLRSH